MTDTLTLSGRNIEPKVNVKLSPSGASSGVAIDEERRLQKWNSIIDVLLDWSLDPSKLEDDGIPAPTKKTIEQAVQFALDFLESRRSPATSVYTNGNGGITFDWQNGPIEEIQIEIFADSHIERFIFEHGLLIHRCPIERDVMSAMR